MGATDERGTPVRQTGWAADGTVTAQLHPVHGYGVAAQSATGPTLVADRSRTHVLEGRTESAESLFVALASVTAEPDPAPVATLADVEITGRTIRVTRENGSTALIGLAPEDLPCPVSISDHRGQPGP
ncbi:hypothetical protein HW130_07680 [Streptomyces sp. PKU-EA00015]|uniref:hypothetical protein n=1 Tax=Streptomyces sp. PKU-EA00015 TaxID=2748326 RepID=UPI0015A0D073|nr:hypothetical protein [Streptomyces sp. PKU-EA00015]NWF26148.1 hypothetical protein [Streptomyces sp. PKU-EA00015]